MGRLFEPSSWAGLAAILLAIAPMVPGNAGIAVNVAAGAAGGIAVKLREVGRA